MQDIKLLPIAEQRRLAVEEALTWIKTPYLSGQMVKGAGCDCLTLLAGTFINAKLVEPFVVPRYSADWFYNQSEETYLNGLLDYCVEQPEDYKPLPGDALLWKFGKCYSHGALVVEWPIIIHAYVGRTCGRDNIDRSIYLQAMKRKYGLKHEGLQPRPMKVFTLKEWA